MTRRNGILAVLAAAVGFMANRAKAGEPLGSSAWTMTNGNIAFEPMSMTFDLDVFKSFTFTQGKDKITFSPAEMMAALKDSSPGQFDGGMVPIDPGMSKPGNR